jgi:transcription initiation factor IIE alpha subunit
VADFPTVAITKACTHEPTTCVICVATSIRTDLNSRLWNEIKCPECRETLEYDDVQRFADEETKER